MLTIEQKQALERGEAVKVTVEGINCILLNEQVYDRVKAVLHDDSDDLPSQSAVAATVRETMAEDDASDPLLDSYQIYKRQS